MSSGQVPLLWLCGEPGVGKSTVGWEVFARLTRDGVKTGYVDIDQLGMCLPESVSDPGRHRTKARNLGAVVANFQAEGVRGVVVSGVVDPAGGRRRYAEAIPRAELTVCSLRCGGEELRRRLARRGLSPGQVHAAPRGGHALDHGDIADVSLDTTRQTVTDVVRMLHERVGDWLRPPRTIGHEPVAPRSPATVCAAPGRVLWLCGATGAGKSTVGWKVYEKVRRAGVTTAFVDLDQIGFCRPFSSSDPLNHRVKSANLAGLWQTFRSAGARSLVVNGPVERSEDIATYARALPATTLTVCRLHAGPGRIRQRILDRRGGGSWPAPGDPLVGRPTAVLHRVADEATATADALDRRALGDLCVDTDGLTVEDAAQAVLTGSGWP